MKKLCLVCFVVSCISENLLGMNVQNHANDGFSRGMMEKFAEIIEQNERKMAALIEQNTADRQILLNEIAERGACLENTKNQIKDM